MLSMKIERRYRRTLIIGQNVINRNERNKTSHVICINTSSNIE